SPANDAGVLTSSTLNGLGMGGNTVVGGRIVPGGITYSNLEALNVNLGYGNNTFTIQSTHAGSTTVTSGRGNDVIDVLTVGGHLNVETGAGNDVVNVSNRSGGDTAVSVEKRGQVVTVRDAAPTDTVRLIVDTFRFESTGHTS